MTVEIDQRDRAVQVTCYRELGDCAIDYYSSARITNTSLSFSTFAKNKLKQAEGHITIYEAQNSFFPW